MHPLLKKSQQIHSHASKLLNEKNIPSFLSSYGTLYFSGSYELDLMTWNDIDMQIALHPGVDPVEALGDFFRYLSKDPHFLEARMIHFKNAYKPKMPRGIYQGIHLDVPFLGGEWKLDLWALDEKELTKNHQLLEKLKKKLSVETKLLILEIKNDIGDKKEKMPKMASHLIYQAILFDGMRDKEEIKQYLNL